jgi:hypothetical protein
MAVLAGGRPVAQDWERADSEIVRREPGAFEDLAAASVQTLSGEAAWCLRRI